MKQSELGAIIIVLGVIALNLDGAGGILAIMLGLAAIIGEGEKNERITKKSNRKTSKRKHKDYSFKAKF